MSGTTTHPLAGKTIATVTTVQMVARDAFQNVITFNQTTITFTDGASHSYCETEDGTDIYEPQARTPANDCTCGAVAFQIRPGEYDCTECGGYHRTCGKADDLISAHGGGASSLFAWASENNIDLKTDHDLTDQEFAALKALAEDETGSTHRR